MYGRKQFPWVVSGIAALLCLYLLIMASQVLGFMETNTGLCVSIGVAALISFVLGYFVFRTVWIAIGMLGLIGGFSLGLMLYSVILAFIGSGAVWAMVLTAISCSVICGLLSFRFANAVVLIMTSVIGAYEFMRGVSYFLGGYPDMAVIFADLENNLPLDDMNNMFWIYLCLFLFVSVAGIVYQIRNNEEHDSLKQDVNYQKNKEDDQFERQVSRKTYSNQPNKMD